GGYGADGHGDGAGGYLPTGGEEVVGRAGAGEHQVVGQGGIGRRGGGDARAGPRGVERYVAHREARGEGAGQLLPAALGAQQVELPRPAALQQGLRQGGRGGLRGYQFGV